MAHWEIDKTFHIEYGHRVWSQQLDSQFCALGDDACTCHHPHGHSGCIRVFLRGSTLNHGMVADFKHLGFLKDFFNRYLDHKFILDLNDPAFTRLTHVQRSADGQNFTYTDAQGHTWEGQLRTVQMSSWNCGWEFDYSSFAAHLADFERDLLDGYFLVDFVPTSEHMARFICQVAQAKFDALQIHVSRVEWNETPKSRAVYISSSRSD